MASNKLIKVTITKSWPQGRLKSNFYIPCMFKLAAGRWLRKQLGRWAAFYACSTNVTHTNTWLWISNNNNFVNPFWMPRFHFREYLTTSTLSGQSMSNVDVDIQIARHNLSSAGIICPDLWRCGVPPQSEILRVNNPRPGPLECKWLRPAWSWAVRRRDQTGKSAHQLLTAAATAAAAAASISTELTAPDEGRSLAGWTSPQLNSSN